MPKKKPGKKTRLNKQKQKETNNDTFAIRQPHSMVISRGKVGKNTLALIEDIKKIYEPYTATNVKVQRTNKLKDFVSIAPTYSVTHIIALNKTDTNLNLRIIRVPRGPTLWFNVKSYILCKDVQNSINRPHVDQHLHTEPALCVMNNFDTSLKQSKLCKTFIQSMFPTTNIPTLKLDSVRRVVIWQYNQEEESIDFRQYVISCIPAGCSKEIKSIIQTGGSLTKKLPDVGKLEDISEFLKEEATEDVNEDFTEQVKSENEDGNEETEKAKINDPKPTLKIKIESDIDGFTSNEDQAHVSLPETIKPNKGNIANEKSKIVLTELGPRLTINLVKVQSGVNDGEILYHKFENKSEQEVLKLATQKLEKIKEKKNRKLEQQKNIEDKILKKKLHRENSLKGMKRKKGVNEEDEEDEEDSSCSSDMDAADGDAPVESKTKNEKYGKKAKT